MSSIHASAAERRARPSVFRSLAICLLWLSPIGFSPMGGVFASPAAAPGKTYFFATRDACMVSGAFSARECAAAFANARLQLRDSAPRFASGGECRLKFRLCEVIRVEPPDDAAMAYAPTDEAVVFSPMALGVEMIASAKGVEAAPTLAIDTRARLFPYYPVARAYEARREEASQPGAAKDNPAILPPDRFEPFSKRKVVGSVMTFTASALGAIENATANADPGETPEQRRARLKAAPFIQ